MNKQDFIVKLTSYLLPISALSFLTFFSIKTYAAGEKSYSGFIGGYTNQLGGTIGDVPGNRFGMEFMFDYHKDELLKNKSKKKSETLETQKDEKKIEALETQSIPQRLERRFTLNAALNDRNLSMYSLNEAYVRRKFGIIEATIGRMILDWSQVDAFWGFGKLNNRQNFNGFTPGLEGLFGLNVKLKGKNGLHLSLYGSPLYVPETNPSLEIDKDSGTITSNHPWANPPSPTADPGNNQGEVPIFYDVDYPGINDVIWRYSGGFQFGWDSEHFNWNAFYMRKPENQPSTTVEVSYNPGDEVIRVAVDPQFYYHDLYGGNLVYKNNNYKLNVSAIAIRPNENPDSSLQAYTYTQIETIKRREDYLCFGMSHQDKQLGLGLSYVARLSPFDRKDDIQAQDPRWNQAVNAYINYVFSASFSAFADIKYDMLTTDRLTMLKGNYLVAKSWSVYGGVNMIGAPTNGNSYWSTFKNNDAVFAGMKYLY